MADKFVTLDYINYDLGNSMQNEAFNRAKEFLEKMVCTVKSNTYREYKAYNLTTPPSHPNREDFGYETLKDGSIIYDVKLQKIYMFSSIPNNGKGEWVEQ